MKYFLALQYSGHSHQWHARSQVLSPCDDRAGGWEWCDTADWCQRTGSRLHWYPPGSACIYLQPCTRWHSPRSSHWLLLRMNGEAYLEATPRPHLEISGLKCSKQRWYIANDKSDSTMRSRINTADCSPWNQGSTAPLLSITTFFGFSSLRNQSSASFLELGRAGRDLLGWLSIWW